MAVVFPSSPTAGQAITVNGKQYIFDGTSWFRWTDSIPPVARVTRGTLAARPSSANDGDIYVVFGDPTASENNIGYTWSQSANQWLVLSGPTGALVAARYVNVPGDTHLTGATTKLFRHPVDELEAATRQYVIDKQAVPQGSITWGGTYSKIGNVVEHVFSNTASATMFVVNKAITAEVLLVGGGGSGGTYAGGGGGAGGVRYYPNMSIAPGGYYVKVGAGGAAVAANTATFGNDGETTSFGNPVYGYNALGGGGGGHGLSGGGGAGRGGGSGGGGGRYGPGGPGQGGHGFQGGTSPPQSGTIVGAGSGGGGASQAGKASGAYDGYSHRAGDGGNGVTYIGRTVGGGGGGSMVEELSSRRAGWGGTGGGGNGGDGGAGSPGTPGTGGGGGGGPVNTASTAGRPSGAGGSGIVVVRYTI